MVNVLVDHVAYMCRVDTVQVYTGAYFKILVAIYQTAWCHNHRTAVTTECYLKMKANYDYQIKYN